MQKAVLGSFKSFALKNPPVLDMKKETSFAKFPTGPLENCGSMFPSLSKLMILFCQTAGNVSSGSLVIRGWGREFVYLEDPEASECAVDGTHFTQRSLDLLRDLQVLPGEPVL